ncbi:MAG: hypothetical protein JO270_15380 [Acidobacteriaceae bacterium]|nr:hypothetical protein [Acidobacteriaceae bacterium]
MRVRKEVASTLALAIMAAMLAACGDRGVVSSAIPTQTRQAADDCNNYQSARRSSSSSSRSLQYVNCPGGGGGGTGTGGGGSGGGGGDCVSAGTCPKTSCADDPTQAKCQVARREPHAGDDCWGSPGPKLGDNMPVSSKDPNTDVVDIAALTFSQSGGGTTSYGWIYTERGGNVYVAENASYRSSFEGFISGIPAVSGLAAALANAHGGLVPISSAAGQAIMQNWGNQPNHDAGSCFTKPLAVT